MEKNEILFMGKIFDTLDKAILYEAKWLDEPLNQEDAERLVSQLGKDIVMNTFLCCKPMTNWEFKKKLNEIFELSINVLRT